MAAVTSAISHNLPPMPVSVSSVPRIRPPRIPKGTPNENSNPQPSGPVPPNKVWVQGKWRDPVTNAARDRQQGQSRKVEKALKRETHGMSIYAYNHIRTKQVVYSLTRIMDSNKILRQLLYHGKKTVPSALRRDMWTPYFSVHFPPTEAGAEAGLLAYHRLRELSAQRQLAPPEDLITATQQGIDAMKARSDPVRLKQMLEYKELKLPIVGQRLPKMLRGRQLMDQKATSVADVSFVLDLHNKGASAEEARQNRVDKMKRRWEAMGRRGKSRLKKIRELEAARLRSTKALAAQVEKRGNSGQLGLDSYAARRVSMEHQGLMIGKGEVRQLQKIEEASAAKDLEAKMRKDLVIIDAEIEALLGGQYTATDADKNAGDSVPEDSVNVEDSSAPAEKGTASGLNPKEVKIMWADMRDGTFAEKWPENVLHGELERFAVSRQLVKAEHKNNKYIDEQGGVIEAPAGHQPKTRVVGRSVHVMGDIEGSGWAPDPKESIAKAEKRQGELTQERELRQKKEDSWQRALQYLDEHRQAWQELGLPLPYRSPALIEERYPESQEVQERYETKSRLDLHLEKLNRHDWEMLKARNFASLRKRGRLDLEGRDWPAELQQARDKWESEWQAMPYEKKVELESQWDQAVQRDSDRGETAITGTNVATSSRLSSAPKFPTEAAKDVPGQTQNRASDVEQKAKQDAERLWKDEGVEVDLPQSGLFDRIKAIFRRR